MKQNSIYWKLAVISAAILILYFEIDASTNTKSSFGSLLFYPLGRRVFVAGIWMLSVASVFLILCQTRFWVITLLILIFLILILFYPGIDMNGVRNAL